MESYEIEIPLNKQVSFKPARHPLVIVTKEPANDSVHGLSRTEFSIAMTHPGDSRRHNRFEAVVVVCNQADYAAMKDFLVRFETCPVVVFMGDA